MFPLCLWLLRVHVYTFLLFPLLLHFNQTVTFVYIFLNTGCTSGAIDSILQVSNPSSNVPPPFSAHAPATTPQTGHQRKVYIFLITAEFCVYPSSYQHRHM